MRPHTREEAAGVLDTRRGVAERSFWRPSAAGSCTPRTSTTCWPGGAFPSADGVRRLPPARERHRHGPCFRARVSSRSRQGVVGAAARPGFFQWVEGAPAEGYRAPRTLPEPRLCAVAPALRRSRLRPRSSRASTAPRCSRPLLARHGRNDVELVAVRNEFFGGNIAVTGLMTGSDVAAVLAGCPRTAGTCCRTSACRTGVFLDGVRVVRAAATGRGRGHRRALATAGPRATPDEADRCPSSSSPAGRTSASRRSSTGSSAGRSPSSSEHPGVTRDRLEVTCDWAGSEFRLVDTGGLVERWRRPRRQGDRAGASGR